MKISICFSILLLFIASSALAQMENKGWWTRDLLTYHLQYDPHDGSGFKRTYSRLLTQPEFGYVINRHMMLGLVTQYSSTVDKYDVPDNQSGLYKTVSRFYGAGPLLRFYIPLGKRVCFMPELFFVYYKGKDSKVFAEMGNLKTTTSTTYNSIGTGAFPSLICFLTRDLALSLTVASVQYYGNKDGHSLTVEINPQQWLLGVEYYFEKRGTKE